MTFDDSPNIPVEWSVAQYYIEAGSIYGINFDPELKSLIISCLYLLPDDVLTFAVTCEGIRNVSIDREFYLETGSTILDAKLQKISFGGDDVDQPSGFKLRLDGELNVEVTCLHVSVMWSGL